MSNLKQPFFAVWQHNKKPISHFNFSSYPSPGKIRQCPEVDGAFLWDQQINRALYQEYDWKTKKQVGNPILFYPREFTSDIEIISGWSRLNVNILKFDLEMIMETWGVVRLAQESVIEKGLIRDVKCCVNKQNHLITVDPQL